MPSTLVNRIASDVGMDVPKIEQWYDEGKAQADAHGWSPNESRYWKYINDYARRKALEVGCKKAGDGLHNAKNSRALQALLKATLSEIEAEKQGLYL